MQKQAAFGAKLWSPIIERPADLVATGGGVDKQDVDRVVQGPDRRGGIRPEEPGVGELR